MSSSLPLPRAHLGINMPHIFHKLNWGHNHHAWTAQKASVQEKDEGPMWSESSKIASDNNLRRWEKGKEIYIYSSMIGAVSWRICIFHNIWKHIDFILTPLSHITTFPPSLFYGMKAEETLKMLFRLLYISKHFHFNYACWLYFIVCFENTVCKKQQWLLHLV